MAAKKGPTPLTEAVLVAQVTDSLGNGFSQSDVRSVVKALKSEIIQSIQEGCKVTLSGLVIFTPSAKAGRKKGTQVYNPFDQTTKTLRSDEPDKFVVKARVSPAVKDGFPKSTTAGGQALVKQLSPARKGRKVA